jgi:hypothetical protein
MPNGEIQPMLDLAEDYIYNTGLAFIKSVLKRKTYDVGSVELKFYVIASNVAALFYAGTKREYKMRAYELLCYIYKSERHQKYLDNVKHPAKSKRNSREIQELLEPSDNEDGDKTS